MTLTLPVVGMMVDMEMVVTGAEVAAAMVVAVEVEEAIEAEVEGIEVVGDGLWRWAYTPKGRLVLGFVALVLE